MSLQVLVKQAGKPRVVLPASLTISDIALSPANSLASITFTTQGLILDQDGNTIGTWLSNAPTGENSGFGFEVFWETDSGSVTAGNPDMWEAIDAGYTFARSQSGVGVATAIGTVTVREFLDNANADTMTVTLEAEVSI